MQHKAKRNYVKTRLNPQLSSKAQWGGMNRLVNPGSSKNQIGSIHTNTGVINNHQQIALEFNTSYINIANRISKDLIPPFCPIDFIQNKLPQPTASLHLFPTTSMEVEKMIKMLKNTLPGLHKIGVDNLICSCEYIYFHLSSFINQSFKQGSFPEELKLALVALLHKRGSRNLINNYRPVSV